MHTGNHVNHIPVSPIEPMLSVPEREMISSSLEVGFGGSLSFVLPVSPVEPMLSEHWKGKPRLQV